MIRALRKCMLVGTCMYVHTDPCGSAGCLSTMGGRRSVKVVEKMEKEGKKMMEESEAMEAGLRRSSLRCMHVVVK